MDDKGISDAEGDALAMYARFVRVRAVVRVVAGVEGGGPLSGIHFVAVREAGFCECGDRGLVEGQPVADAGHVSLKAADVDGSNGEEGGCSCQKGRG